MAHPGEEIALGCVRLLRGRQRSRQLLLLALLAPHDIGYIGAHDTDPPQFSADIEHFKPLDPHVAVLIPHLRHKGVSVLIL